MTNCSSQVCSKLEPKEKKHTVSPNLIQFAFKTFAICCAGNLDSNQEVFNWILEQKADQSIELINRDQLVEYIASRDFLAVVFCKYANFKVFAKYELHKTRQATSLYYPYITQMV